MKAPGPQSAQSADASVGGAGGDSLPEDTGEIVPGEEQVLGERSVSSVNRARSLQARLTNLLAVTLMVALAVGLLAWYYREAYVHHVRGRTARSEPTASPRAADAPLPPLGPIDPPVIGSTPVTTGSAESAENAASPALSRLLGPAPPVPMLAADPGLPGAVPGSGVRRTIPVRDSALARELGGPAFADASGSQGAEAAPIVAGAPGASEAAPMAYESARPTSGASASGQLASLLTPSVTAPVRASVLPSEELLLPKGAFIDCTLETAIDSSLPGLTTCITATDTFSADGRVVLLERGTKLVGETQGVVQPGASRVFVLWTEARTPTGVIVPLDSPGTDELGRSGLSGTVNRHFFERFGAAMLISVIDGAVQAGIASQSRGGGVIYDPTGTEGVMTEALRGTLDIAPTIVKRNGDRIEVLVARDIDFRSVYELRAAPAR